MRPKIQRNEYIRVETVILNKKLVEPTVLYQAPSYDVNSRDDRTPFPNFNDEPEPDDLCPEGSVTMMFWKNLYEGIEQRRQEAINNR